MVANSADLHFSGLLRCIIQEGLLTESDAQTYSTDAKTKSSFD